MKRNYGMRDDLSLYCSIRVGLGTTTESKTADETTTQIKLKSTTKNYQTKCK
jgi:hypothetical protein